MCRGVCMRSKHCQIIYTIETVFHVHIKLCVCIYIYIQFDIHEWFNAIVYGLKSEIQQETRAEFRAEGEQEPPH